MTPEEIIAKVLEGFDKGVFVRDVSRDSDSHWAVRALPYLVALSKLAELPAALAASEQYHGHEKCVAKADADKALADMQEFWRREVDVLRSREEDAKGLVQRLDARLAASEQEAKVWKDTADSYSDTLDALKAQLQASEQRVREAEEWDVRRFFETLKASGLDGLSHEDGWTLMATETANGLKAEREELKNKLDYAVTDVRQMEAALATIRERLTPERVAQAICDAESDYLGLPRVQRNFSDEAYDLYVRAATVVCALLETPSTERSG